MNFYTDEYYQKQVKFHYEIACAKYGEDRVFGIFLFGSQNYGLGTETSDVDTKCIILPSWEDIYKGKRLTAETIELENGEHIEVRDIRSYMDQFRKQNINMLEILFTKYYVINTKYKAVWAALRTNRENIAHYNQYQAIKTMAGMCKEKHNQLFKDTPSHHADIEKFGYSRKEFCHLVRIAEFLQRYGKGETYSECLLTSHDFLLKTFKKEGFDKDKVRAAADLMLREVEVLADHLLELTPEYIDEEVEYVLDTALHTTMHLYLREVVR